MTEPKAGETWVLGFGSNSVIYHVLNVHPDKTRTGSTCARVLDLSDGTTKEVVFPPFRTGWRRIA